MMKLIVQRIKWLTIALIPLFLLSGCNRNYVVLNPHGPVAQKEYQLIITSAILIAIIVVPVILLLFYIVYRFQDRPGNKAPYEPEFSESLLLETLWWGIPVIIVAFLAFYTGRTIFSLVKPPVTDRSPITIQVTSLDWKWLFQYPDQKVATVNYVDIPAGVPVQFVLTSDAPMNSFWVPELGGQEYTMPGMAMRLWLQADKPGTYFGTGAMFSGEQYAHMRFNVVAKTQADFNTWVNQIKSSAPAMTKAKYEALKQPGVSETLSFSSYPANSFEQTVEKNGRNSKNMHRNMDITKLNGKGVSGTD